MATDATGTPSTNFAFPKYNVNADAPSGLGLNAIVDDIDSKLLTRFVHSTDAKATDEVPVWNGTDFVYQKITNAQVTIPYQAHTLVLTAAGGGSPTVGNGTVVARYLQIGKMVHYYGALTFGSTTNFGTGVTQFSLPVTATSALGARGTLRLLDASTGAQYFAHVANSPTVLSGEYVTAFGGAAANVTALGPFTWAAGDVFEWNLTYEAA